MKSSTTRMFSWLCRPNTDVYLNFLFIHMSWWILENRIGLCDFPMCSHAVFKVFETDSSRLILMTIVFALLEALLYSLWQILRRMTISLLYFKFKMICFKSNLVDENGFQYDLFSHVDWICYTHYASNFWNSSFAILRILMSV